MRPAIIWTIMIEVLSPDVTEVKEITRSVSSNVIQDESLALWSGVLLDILNYTYSKFQWITLHQWNCITWGPPASSAPVRSCIASIQRPCMFYSLYASLLQWRTYSASAVSCLYTGYVAYWTCPWLHWSAPNIHRA